MLPSELLEQALDDLELCMKEPGYNEYMAHARQNKMFCLSGRSLLGSDLQGASTHFDVSK